MVHICAWRSADPRLPLVLLCSVLSVSVENNSNNKGGAINPIADPANGKTINVIPDMTI